MQISAHYKIPQQDLPFLDVHVDRDNPLYLDPLAIRQSSAAHPSPYGSTGLACLESFFHTVTGYALSTRSGDQKRGEKLLQTFSEPTETRLGMSRVGYRGKGGASDTGTRIWEALNSDAQRMLSVGVFYRLEDLTLFVEGVGADITSDVTTRVLFKALAEFTSQMLTAYPQFSSGGHTLQTAEYSVWDPATKTWQLQEIELPVADDHPLLLVPRDWARADLLLSYNGFYQKGILTYVQEQQTRVLPDGKLAKPPKKKISQQREYQRGRATVLRVLEQARQNEDDILQRFRDRLDSEFSPYSDEKLRELLSKASAA